MSGEGELGQRGTTPPLPRSIWVVAWSSLVGQCLWLAERGIRMDGAVSTVGSVVLGGLVIGYVSAGVVRARTVRLVVAWVVLVLVLAGDVGLLLGDDSRRTGFVVLSLASTVSAVAGLAMFHRTDWFAWQRTRPPDGRGAPTGRLVVIGVLVGVLGGLVGPLTAV